MASGRKRLHTAAFHRSKVAGIREANGDSARCLLIGCDRKSIDEVIMMIETQLCVKQTSFLLLQSIIINKLTTAEDHNIMV